MFRSRLFFLITCGIALSGAAAVLAGYPAEDAAIRMQHDIQAVEVSRSGLERVIAFMAARPDLFPAERRTEDRLLTRLQREQVWVTWQTFLEYLLALDSIQERYADYRQIDDRQDRETAFRIAYAAFLANYRHALEFIERIGNDPDLDVVLNEPVPELDLPGRSYAELKRHYLNVILGLEFAQHAARYAVYGPDAGLALTGYIAADAARIWAAGKGAGPAATVRNGMQIVRDTAFRAYFPLQKGVSQWMGDVKVLRPELSLITGEQVRELAPLLEPGDILLERREWYLSNIGLPGFWPHAALYIGTAAERRSYFDTREVAAWLAAAGTASGDFEALLQQRYPEAYANSLAQHHGDPARVIEAVSEGVVFTTLEHSAAADSVVVLRPRLTRLEKARALLRAFHYSGRPYDFNFDFRTDDSLVCTELVYKAYEPAPDYRGLHLPVVDILGRPVTPANEIARQFDSDYGTDRQELDFVAFLDGDERARISRPSEVAAFRDSWRRPKWHILKKIPDPDD